MPNRATGRSAITPWKDEHVPVLGMKVLRTAQNVVARNHWYPSLVVMDLTAGYGIADDGRRSIVVALLDAATTAVPPVLPALAYLCERDREVYRVLAARTAERYHDMAGLHVETYFGDAARSAPLIERDLAARLSSAGQPRHHVCGLILVDPCGDGPWDAARGLSAAYPVMDVLVYAGAATTKWHEKSNGNPRLADELAGFGKKHRFTGRPRGHFQWVVNLLTDFDYKGSLKHELEPVDSAAGRAWANRTDHTREELKTLYQQPLAFDFPGEDT